MEGIGILAFMAVHATTVISKLLVRALPNMKEQHVQVRLKADLHK